MATIATRITADGVYYTNGEFDEVTKTVISVTPTTVYAAELDEVSINPVSNGLAKREYFNGNLHVAGYFDEVTGIS